MQVPVLGYEGTVIFIHIHPKSSLSGLLSIPSFAFLSSLNFSFWEGFCSPRISRITWNLFVSIRQLSKKVLGSMTDWKQRRNWEKSGLLGQTSSFRPFPNPPVPENWCQTPIPSSSRKYLKWELPQHLEVRSQTEHPVQRGFWGLWNHCSDLGNSQEFSVGRKISKADKHRQREGIPWLTTFSLLLFWRCIWVTNIRE